MLARWSLLAGALCGPSLATAAQDTEALLSGFSSSEQISIRSACGVAGLSGPASLVACIRTKAAELKRSPGPPDLSGLSSSVQASIRNACGGASLAGPASFYTCLHTKAADLRRSPGPPDLSAFSSGEQASMHSACGAANLSGPARLYECLRSKVAELRRSPGPPDLSAFSSGDQASMRSACGGANLSGPASYYECLRAQAAELRRSNASPRPAAPASAVSRPAGVRPPRNPAAPRVALPLVRDPSKSNAQATAVVAQPSVLRPPTPSSEAVPNPNPRADSGRWLGWILVLLGLAGLPVARHFYRKARTKPCSVCNTLTSNADGVCGACLRKTDDGRKRREQEAAAARAREQAEARRRAEEGSSAFDPNAVLGVPEGATLDQIRTAYRTLIVQYHPDKVAQLGPELRQLAAEKSQQINDAYQLLEREAR
jgi:hypothetical protein